MTIRFWNTRQLVIELAEGRVSEYVAFQYFLANSVLWSLVLYYSALMNASANWLYLYEVVVVVVIIILGIQQCYKENGGSSGQEFVMRAICLSFPIGLKILLLEIVLGCGVNLYFLSVVDWATFRDPVRVFNLLLFAWGVGFTALFYWRLWFNFAAIQKYVASNPPLNRTRADDEHTV